MMAWCSSDYCIQISRLLFLLLSDPEVLQREEMGFIGLGILGWWSNSARLTARAAHKDEKCHFVAFLELPSPFLGDCDTGSDFKFNKFDITVFFLLTYGQSWCDCTKHGSQTIWTITKSMFCLSRAAAWDPSRHFSGPVASPVTNSLWHHH